MGKTSIINHWLCQSMNQPSLRPCPTPLPHRGSPHSLQRYFQTNSMERWRWPIPLPHRQILNSLSPPPPTCPPCLLTHLLNHCLHHHEPNQPQFNHPHLLQNSHTHSTKPTRYTPLHILPPTHHPLNHPAPTSTPTTTQHTTNQPCPPPPTLQSTSSPTPHSHQLPGHNLQ